MYNRLSDRGGKSAVKVLLVDDSTLSRKVQVKVLRDVGVASVIEAKNGRDALDKLEQAGFAVDLLMTDWNMPEMDGVRLIEAVRRDPRGKNLPVIVVSSEFEPSRIGQAFAAGAHSYVTKPFHKDALARKIASARSVAELAAAPPARAVTSSASDVPHLEGDLERMGFAELVGFLNFSKKSGELAIHLRASGTGEDPDVADAGVSFVDGEVKDAWIGRFASEEAFRALARLKGGRFSFHEGRPPRGSRVQRPTMTLLLEAMREMDEESRGDG